MIDLTGKRALVTGASRGIGAAIAQTLAAQGADVVITYEHSAELAEQVVEKIKRSGRKGFALQANSGAAAPLEVAVNQAASLLGGIDILVNNAGIARGGLLSEQSVDDINALLDVNIRGVILATKYALPHLAEGGRIISIGSCLAERVPFEQVAVYSATKSALMAFTRGMARELGRRGITINLVHPGPTETDMNPAEGDQADMMRGFMALGHYGTPMDVAAAVAFLAGPEAGQITGTGITVDGGINA